MEKAMKIVDKAGGIVLNPDGDILIVTNNIGRVTLPKGSLEQDETHEEAATREILEESGLAKVSLIRELGYMERLGYTADNHNYPSVIKRIRFYLFTTDEYELHPTVTDIVDARWVKPGEVTNCLSWQEEIDFFTQQRDKLKV